MSTANPIAGFSLHRAIVRSSDNSTGVSQVEIPEWVGYGASVEVSNQGLTNIDNIWNVPAVGSTVFVAANRLLDRVFLVTGPPPPLGGTAASNIGFYGAFSDYTTQTIASTTVAYPMRIGQLDEAYGVSVQLDNFGNKTRVTVANNGVYNVQWSGQFNNVDNFDHDAKVWMRRNGVDIVGSTGVINVPSRHGSTNGHCIAGWNFVMTLGATDYLELVWSSDSVDVSMITFPASTSPAGPTTASLIVTVQQVTNVQIGPDGTVGAILVTANNLSELTPTAATARTNLELGTAATTASTDYATAAQGTLATNAAPSTRTISTTAPLTGGGDLSANRTLAVSTGTSAAVGVLQLATAAEVVTGSNTTKAVTAAGVFGRGRAVKAAGSVYASAAGTVTATTATDMTGCTVTLTIATGDTVQVWANADLTQNVAGITGIMCLSVGGVEQSQQALMLIGTGARMMVSQSWTLSPSAGSVIFKLTLRTLATGSFTYSTPHTGFTYAHYSA